MLKLFISFCIEIKGQARQREQNTKKKIWGVFNILTVLLRLASNLPQCRLCFDWAAAVLFICLEDGNDLETFVFSDKTI